MEFFPWPQRLTHLPKAILLKKVRTHLDNLRPPRLKPCLLALHFPSNDSFLLIPMPLARGEQES